MVSVFFKNDRLPAKVDLPTPDWVAALTAVSDKKSAVVVAAIGGLQPAQAEWLIAECKRLDAVLVDEVANDRARTYADAVAAVEHARSDPAVSASRFVDQAQTNSGGTFPQLVTVCKAEQDAASGAMAKG